MFSSIRRYRLTHGSTEELTRRVDRGFAEEIELQPGFVSYELIDCGDAPWGAIPVEPNTVYVDASYALGDSDGSPGKPWSTLAAAISAAEPGAIVAVAAGTYTADVVITGKPVRLWGRCPTLVTLVGSNPDGAAVSVDAGAAGSEIRGIAVTGAGIGIAITGDVLLDAVRSGDRSVARDAVITHYVGVGFGDTRSLPEIAGVIQGMIRLGVTPPSQDR